jgi:hypothetical protein
MFRRAFLSHFTGAGALLASAQPAAAAATTQSGPARHAQDDWLDEAPRRHRVIFDSWMADTFGEAVGFAGNWARVNKESYGLTDADLAIIIVARHGSAPYAFSDAIWAPPCSSQQGS